jgi:protein phosphatase
MNITITKPCAISEKCSRTYNEDLIYPSPETVTSSQRLFLLCGRGTGRSDKSEIAGALACEYFKTFFTTMLDTEAPTQEFIQKALQYTEVNLKTYLSENPDAGRMSKSLAMLHISGSGITIAHSGNSRIYQYRNGKIVRKNHSAGAIGQSHARINVSLIQDLQPDDCFFLYVDKNEENIPDEEFHHIFRHKIPAEEIKDRLVEMCDNRECDNYSFYIIPIQGVQETVGYRKNILSFLYSFMCIYEYFHVLLPA